MTGRGWCVCVCVCVRVCGVDQLAITQAEVAVPGVTAWPPRGTVPRGCRSTHPHSAPSANGPVLARYTPIPRNALGMRV